MRYEWRCVVTEYSIPSNIGATNLEYKRPSTQAPWQCTVHGITIRENPLIHPGNAMMISGDNRMVIKIKDRT